MARMNELIPICEPVLGEREAELVREAVESGWVSSRGPFVERFEREFARRCDAREAVAVCNGTAALHLALHALGVQAGDEVIVPDLTFVATANAVLMTGATPVLVDVEPDTWCIDPRAIELALTPRTKAILPVHLYGHPAEMGPICDIAHENGLLVVEDAAEALGARSGSTPVGAIGDAGAFSLYANKLITTGEGGVVVTNDAALAARMRSQRGHSMDPERAYFHGELGFNYRLTNLQAALGVAQLERVDGLIEQKRRIFSWYSELLSSCGGPSSNVERPGTTNSFWMTCVVLPPGLDRDRVATHMAEHEIETRPFFQAMSSLPHLAQCRRVGRDGAHTPRATELGARGLSLPSSCKLTRPEVARVVDALVSAIDRERA